MAIKNRQKIYPKKEDFMKKLVLIEGGKGRDKKVVSLRNYLDEIIYLLCVECRRVVVSDFATAGEKCPNCHIPWRAIR